VSVSANRLPHNIASNPNINIMKKICLKGIASGAYIRVAEDCESHRNIGLISERDGECWLWVKENPSVSGAILYSAKDRSSFTPHASNPDSTPRGGTGYLGGRKFTNRNNVEAYLSKHGKVVWC